MFVNRFSRYQKPCRIFFCKAFELNGYLKQIQYQTSKLEPQIYSKTEIFKIDSELKIDIHNFV